MITPPGRGALLYKQSAYIASLVLFALGAVLSAATVGVLCGVVGILLATWTPWLRMAISSLIATVAITYGFAGVLGATLPTPTRHWQVPKQWGQYGKPFFAAAFGLILGAGFFTFVNFIGYYLLLASCIMLADPLLGGMLMIVYGAVRAVPVLCAPLVSLARGQMYTIETAVAVTVWFTRIDRYIMWMRTAVLFMVAGSAFAMSGLIRIP